MRRENYDGKYTHTNIQHCESIRDEKVDEYLIKKVANSTLGNIIRIIATYLIWKKKWFEKRWIETQEKALDAENT